MKQLLLQLLLLAAGGAIQAAPLAAFPATEYALPCDHGLAHTPDLPDGSRRSFSVAVEAPSNAGTLPPGRRRFDAVLPDEEGHDLKTSTPARGQRQIEQDVVNEVAAGHWESTAAPTRLRRLRLEKVSDIGNPDFADHDPKSDAVVDSPERVRRFPTHLAGRDDAGAAENDDPLSSNDIPDAPTRDQLALEDVPTASTEQREDLGAAVSEADSDLPLGYRSKFPKKTFSSDAGGGGDVLRVSPRQSVHRYQATTPETLPEMGVAHTRSMGRRVRPSQASLQEFQDTEASVPSDPTGPGSQYRGTQGFRESHRVGSGEPRRPAVQSELAQRTQLDQRRPGAVAVDIQPRRRRPRPQGREPSGEEELRDRVEPLSRRRLRPRPTVPALTDEVPVARAPFLDAHLQMRIRPRPAQTAAFEMDGELDNGVHKQIAERHRGIGTVTETNTSEEVPQNIQQMSRSHNSRSTTGATIQDVPQVQVEHDGTALEKKEQRQGPSFTLIRSAVKQGAGIRGGPSPALVQKIVRNTLRRLKPQIAEHDGDVGVDILVKIIQVEE